MKKIIPGETEDYISGVPGLTLKSTVGLTLIFLFLALAFTIVLIFLGVGE